MKLWRLVCLVITIGIVGLLTCRVAFRALAGWKPLNVRVFLTTPGIGWPHTREVQVIQFTWYRGEDYLWWRPLPLKSYFVLTYRVACDDEGPSFAGFTPLGSPTFRYHVGTRTALAAQLPVARAIRVPMWFSVIAGLLAAGLFTLPLLLCVRAYVRRRRGLCVACGYDLRGTTGDACPECGQLIRPQGGDKGDIHN